MSITFIILGITIAVSIVALTKREYFYRLEYNPFSVLQRKQWHRLFSHALIHVDYMHLAVNMWVLYIFGGNVEFLYGLMFGSKSKWFFILLYVGGILFASLPALKKHRDNPNYSAVGASGAVSAVLFAAILLEPMRSIGFLFIPIGMPAFVFGILYLAYEIYMDKRSNDRIAHDAHYWGAIFGVVFTFILEPSIVLNYFI